MVELVLEQYVGAEALEAAEKDWREVIPKVAGVTTPGQRDHLDRVAASGEMPYQFPVVQITTGERLQTSVNDQAELHTRGKIGD